MKGDCVIVRAYGGEPLARRVWNEDSHVVQITNDEQFKLLTEGKEVLEPIRFPRSDVFKYHFELAVSMDQLYRDGKWDWNKLVRF